MGLADCKQYCQYFLCDAEFSDKTLVVWEYRQLNILHVWIKKFLGNQKAFLDLA